MLTLDINNRLTGALVISNLNNYIKFKIDDPKNGVYLLNLCAGEETLFTSQLSGGGEEMSASVPYLPEMITGDITAELMISNGPVVTVSNAVKITLDKNKLKQVRPHQNAESLKLAKDFAELRKEVKDLVSGLVVKHIPEFSKESLRKGMVPTVTDDAGTVSFAFPFNDSITTVNGKKAAGKALELKAEDIPHGGQTVGKLLDTLVDSMQKNCENIAGMLPALKDLTKKVSEIEIRLIDLEN